MKRAAVTGSSGFLGSHLAARFDARPGWRAVRIGRREFETGRLGEALRGCSVVFHFAGISRSADAAAMYETNMRLIRDVLAAVESNREPLRLFFASTTHEAKESAYHASKRDGRRAVEEAARASGRFEGIGLLLPNVFGPGGKPFYNSVTSTFCRQIALGETPTVHPGAGRTRLIYIDTLLDRLVELAEAEKLPPSPVTIADEFDAEVADIAARLRKLKDGKPPEDRFDECLAVTLHSCCGGGESRQETGS